MNGKNGTFRIKDFPNRKQKKTLRFLLPRHTIEHTILRSLLIDLLIQISLRLLRDAPGTGHTIFNKLFIFPSRFKIKQVYILRTPHKTLAFESSLAHSLTHSRGLFNFIHGQNPERITLLLLSSPFDLPRFTTPESTTASQNLLSGTCCSGTGITGSELSRSVHAPECLLR